MDGVIPATIAEAVALARRQARRADVDLGPVVDHFATTLPLVVEELGLRVDGVFDHGRLPTVAVTLADGTPGVAKLRLPGELDIEARVMAAGVPAYAAVLLHDPIRGLLVTERLGHRLGDRHPGLAEQVSVVVPLLRRAWDTPRGAGGPVEHKAEGLLRILADLGDRYGGRHAAALGRARRLAAELARDERPEVVCHGDPHAWNVLARADTWAFVDPDGFVGEAAYDVGVLLRGAPDELLAADRVAPGGATALLRDVCEVASRAAGLDAARVWAWASVERVTTGLYLHWYGEHEEAERYLAVAGILAD